jgi:hypothetical protein
MISQANLQYGQPYGYQALRNGAQPTADATAVPADPTTAVAPPDATALTAQPADAYTSSTALAPAPQVEEGKKKTNWLAWGAAGLAAVGLGLLAGKHFFGAEVTKPLAAAAPEVANTVAEAGQKAATAATKAVDDVKKAVSHKFGDIDLNDTPEGVFTKLATLIDDEKKITTVQLNSLRRFDPKITAQDAVRIKYGNFPDLENLADPTKWATPNIWFGSGKVQRITLDRKDQLEALVELAKAGDPIATAKLNKGHFVLQSVPSGSKNFLKYVFVQGPVHSREVDGIQAFYRHALASGSSTALKDTQALAEKFNLEVVSNAQGLKIGTKGGESHLFPSLQALKSYDEKSIVSQYEFFHPDGSKFTDDQVKNYFVSLKNSDKAVRDQHLENWGRHTVSIGAKQNPQGVITNPGKITINTSGPSTDEPFF